jgi:hypothetical protein
VLQRYLRSYSGYPYTIGLGKLCNANVVHCPVTE